MEPFIGQLCLFGFNFVPTGWAACNGQLLSIAQNSALFALLGTTYGGDGRVTFGLPDLRGRVPLNQGQGPGLSNYTIGQVGGSETSTLTVNNLPAHNHTINANSNAGTATSPQGAILAGAAISSLPPAGPYTTGAANTALAASAVGNTGGGQPINNLSPYLVLNWCIATQGIFPSRS